MLCSRIALRAPPTSSWFVKECLAYLCRNALAYLCRNARARSLLMRCTRCNACEVTGADVHARFRTGLTYTFVSAPDGRSQASLHVNCSLRSLRLALVSRCLPSLARRLAHSSRSAARQPGSARRRAISDACRVFLLCSACAAARHASARSQFGIAKCCARRKFRPTVGSGSFPFRYQRRAGAERQGEDPGASDVPLGSRVRSPSSAGRRLAGIAPGVAEVEEPADSLTSGMRESRG